eukprot:TRINITY_DN1763_c0_g1_i5.p1 TRINITY_DN1763_c0_g1~~TRINITY_DN1763_c0_g1_i5.p1  ORF type:complete len:300 (-),score=45.55 TRINITY_DN1763_c0_g1_i5:103-1002(-)
MNCQRCFVFTGDSVDVFTGAGILSQDIYLYGFFSASIKLPEDYTAGVVAAFYASNGDMFEKTHDELDFEFLGNIRGKEWRVQTNIYGNGSTDAGREERYTLWFDPSEDFHQYSILWTHHSIVFFVDEVPIREVQRREAMGGQYPSKPMSIYATIWDGSSWATLGGRYKANYKYEPFLMNLSNLILEGCAVDPLQQPHTFTHCKSHLDSSSSVLSENERALMKWFRSKYMSYSYCDDWVRYPTALVECPARDGKRYVAEAMRFHGHGHGHGHGHSHSRRRRGGSHHRPLPTTDVASSSLQ